MEEFLVPQFAELKEIDVVVQQVVVNNQVQDILGKSWVIACPQCGRVLYRFPQGISEVEAHKARNQGVNELLKIATYCPSCGIKLSYGPGEEIIEESIEPINNNE